jgi:hypothetical protein
MKDFIKENWFKLGLVVGLLLIALSIAYYFILFLPIQKQKNINQKDGLSSIDQQSKCSIQARKFFNDEIDNEKTTDMNVRTSGTQASFENHYNVKLNKCFIYTSIFSSNYNYRSRGLYDVNENKTYAEFQEIVTKKQQSDYTPVACSMLNKSCVTQEEFDSFVKPYMEE